MKPLLILMRIIFVGIFWSIFFLEGIRVIMLKNWRFDLLRKDHWEYAWDLWLSGWIISDAKEWAFVLIILTFIPLWLTGWAALSVVVWEKVFLSILKFPVTLFKRLFFQQVKIIAATTGVKKIKKKKSYKEIRPKSIRAPIDEHIYETASSAQAKMPISTAPVIEPLAPVAQAQPALSQPATENKFDHSLFKFDEDEDFDFDFDAFDDDKKSDKESDEDEVETAAAPVEVSVPEKSNKQTKKEKAPKKDNAPAKDNANKQQKNRNNNAQANQNNSKGNGNSTLDVIKQKGYEVITGATIKNTLIDFIGVAANQICICLIDKEPGDWLADEERFNDEEPLWFSESSHRISPVRKVDLARQHLIDKLENADFHFDVKAYVIEQIGNIINAEDMFEIWDDIGVNVTRIDRGTPKELKLFSKTLDEAIESIDKDKLEKIKKQIRSIS